MFNFIKKSTVLAAEAGGFEERDGDKERRKREKKERKEREKRERIAAGLEEPLRLEEVRRSLKLRGRRKEKEKLPSGITADYTASLFAHLEQDSNYSNYPIISTSGSNSNLSDENNHLSTYPNTQTWNKRDNIQSDSSETSLNSLNNPNNANSSPRQTSNLPPIPPRPPKRGILKGTRLSNTSSNSQESNVQNNDTVDYVNGQDPNVLARNTQHNELIAYRIPPSKSTSSSDDMQLMQNFTKKVIHSPVETQYNYKSNVNTPSITTQDVDEAPKTNGNNYLGVTSTSPSADSLTDTTTNSSFGTPPFSTSPVGESQGFHRWSKHSTFDDVHLPLPALSPMPLPKPRTLTIQRQKAPRNDFGFSLRRAVIQERLFITNAKEFNGHSTIDENVTNGEATNFNGVNGNATQLNYKAVILAEPGSYPGGSETGLLPGDRLLEVNGVVVDGKSREEVIELIKNSQDSVTIKVQPTAELSELSRRRAVDGGGDVELDDSNVRGGTLSRSGSRRFTSPQAKSEEQLACEKEWLEAGRVWLAHRGGFTAVRREGDADGGRVRVRVLQTGELLTVDEDDLEKANPPQLERCEDIASLRCLNECGALHVLRARYAAGLPHARAGHALLVLGPPRRSAPIYTEKVAAMFRGCRADDMPPHVFAAAQSAHRCMLASRRDRAIVFLGRSGAGKTSAMRHCVWYLATAYSAPASRLTPERLDAAFDVLHAFGSCRSESNPHASRFVSLTSLDFDGGGALVSASVQTLLPDLNPGSVSLRALHILVHGCDGRLRRELGLDHAPGSASSAAANPYVSRDDKEDAPAQFAALREALQLLGVTEQEQMAVWKVLAAVYHLGWAGSAKSTGTLRYQFASAESGSRAARLLGAHTEELARSVFSTAAPPPSPHPPPALHPATPPAPHAPPVPPRANFRTPSPSHEKELSGPEALEAFVAGLYNETFNIIAALVNRSVSTSARTSASLLLLDSPGADNPLSAGRQGGAPLSNLLSNYLQERLQTVFHEATLVAPRERYAQEGIALEDGAEEDWLSETVNPGPMVELLDKSPQNSIVRSSQTDLRECDRRGLLWLLDEESMYPGSSDDTFLERVMTHYGPPSHTQYLIKKAPHARQFVLQHLQGTNPVLYDVSGWVKASRENPVTKKALTLLQESQNEELSRLSAWSRGACGVGAWSAAVGDASTLRRASSIRRTLTTGAAGMKRRSRALQAKFVADGVVDTLRRCGAGGVHFVCCLLAARPTLEREDMAAGHAGQASDVNVPLLRSQFRGFQLLDAARLYKQGFPEHMPLAEFARRYRLLAHSEGEGDATPQQTGPMSDRHLVDDMLLNLDLDVTSYRLGLTQIMFRGGTVGGLDARRDAALARVLVRLQARARGVLARRRAARLRTLQTAARCVQRNVRAFMAVRDWPWWRLLVRVTPLLAVHRTEHRLKQAQEELETLRTKLEKVEHERSHFKNENERLETKLSECGGELTEERAAAALATERADAEAAERLRVERDNRDLVTNNQRLQQASERLELELLHWRSSEADAEPPSSDCDEGVGSEGEPGAADKYRRRCERAQRELQLLKAQLRRQHEDDLEQLVAVKKQLEKKVQDAYEEVEEQRAVAAQWKRKLQKLTNDMADLRSLLDEQTCRNNLLEKRQRKFDGELHAAQEELKRERSVRERLSREKDQAQAEKYSIEQSLSEARLELELKEERLSAATRELEERGGGGDELAAVRRQRAELERRARDQEEELDDLAGQIQLLESSKLRLEMLLEQQRKEARLEAAARDDEMEETRANSTKKLKMLESQLESEHAERSLLLRERHELERRLAALEEAARTQGHEQAALVQRLKRDLKRYRALLRDAQTMLEQKEKEGGGKAQIRQLKNQVEDLEVSVRAATKARQTAEAEAAETAAALEEALRTRSEATERASLAARDAAAARAQLDDAEEEAAELLKKYRTSTTALVGAQTEAREAGARAEAAAEDARGLRERLAEMTARVARAEAGHAHGQTEAERRLELRNKELESSVELEATARVRLEAQTARLRDAHDQLAAELAAARARDLLAGDDLRKLNRQIRELKEENCSLHARLGEAARARAAAEGAASAAAAEAAGAREEARLAGRRAAALQEAIAGDLSSPADDRDSDSENDSYSSDESIGTFLANHKLSPSAPSRTSLHLDTNKSHTPEGRQSRSSVGSGKQLSPTKESFA